jgi:hypothetical protein
VRGQLRATTESRRGRPPRRRAPRRRGPGRRRAGASAWPAMMYGSSNGGPTTFRSEHRRFGVGLGEVIACSTTRAPRASVLHLHVRRRAGHDGGRDAEPGGVVGGALGVVWPTSPPRHAGAPRGSAGADGRRAPVLERHMCAGFSNLSHRLAPVIAAGSATAASASAPRRGPAPRRRDVGGDG